MHYLSKHVLKADRIVASLDENARALFQVDELNVVTWVNPVSERTRIQAGWNRARHPVDEWKLGNRR